MDKYTLLLILNLPIALMGLLAVLEQYHKKRIGKISLILKTMFWLSVIIGLLFSDTLYEYLVANSLTDSTPLSIMDVVLITGLNVSLVMHSSQFIKLDNLERQINELHEILSIKLSKK
ncbi:MAG: DUF2304 family protein [Bacteroidetes bacterium]|nr:DUF2304 family protein [Bacteroidota bacterium]MCB9817850.1 DUF2304 family protein [Candidatus Nomurabacteria bacterium]